MTILLTFATHEGQTQRIADRIAADLTQQGCDVHVVEIGDAPSAQGYDAVVVGAPVRYERHGRKIVRYLRRERDVLGRVPFVFFQVSMTSAQTDDAHDAKARQLVDALMDRTAVRPVLVARFAGALRYTRYGWVTKRIMRTIARREGNATDTRRDHEYTDWEAVDRFAADIVMLLAKRVVR
jgi:menaquinone-dependent protoporphyrinogen oxidase